MFKFPTTTTAFGVWEKKKRAQKTSQPDSQTASNHCHIYIKNLITINAACMLWMDQHFFFFFFIFTFLWICKDIEKVNLSILVFETKKKKKFPFHPDTHSKHDYHHHHHHHHCFNEEMLCNVIFFRFFIFPRMVQFGLVWFNHIHTHTISISRFSARKKNDKINEMKRRETKQNKNENDNHTIKLLIINVYVFCRHIFFCFVLYFTTIVV